LLHKRIQILIPENLAGNKKLPVFEMKVTITVSARNKEEAERLVDSRLIRLESDVILKTERTETREVPQ
jgi:hypothetical protein